MIDEDGTQVGIKSINEALELAQQRGNDLVEIVPQSTPPVCKIVNYSKLRYEVEKKEREARKKNKTTHLKEVRVRPRISPHDLEIKINHAREFLSEQDKVQITVMFSGREIQHKDLGIALMNKIKLTLADIADVEQQPVTMGSRMFLLLAPKK